MKSWIFAFVGLSCLVTSFAAPAFARQGAKPDPVKPPVEQKPLKEVKFKVEWTGTSKGQPTSASESVMIVGAEGEMSMSNNQLAGSDVYRKVTLRAESAPDGSYIVDISVSESTREQDIPRMSTVVKVKKGETKIVQTRSSKNSNGETEYVCSITPVVD